MFSWRPWGEQNDPESPEALAKKEEEQRQKDLRLLPHRCGVYFEEMEVCSEQQRQDMFEFRTKKPFNEAKCAKWGRAFENCVKWSSQDDKEALAKVIKFEKNERALRKMAVLENDVWEYRSEPPADWNQPLPDGLIVRMEDSPLDRKAEFENLENRKAELQKILDEKINTPTPVIYDPSSD